MKFPLILTLALVVAACNSPPLPELSPGDAASPEAPVHAVPYHPVMAGTAAHVPAGLKPWRELNDSVAPGAGRSP
jgi:hypothetical protein